MSPEVRSSNTDAVLSTGMGGGPSDVLCRVSDDSDADGLWKATL